MALGIGMSLHSSSLTQEEAFIFSVKTDNTGSSNSTSFTVPLSASGSNKPIINIDWGDGNTNEDVEDAITHDYGTAGTYTIKITPGTSYVKGTAASSVTYPALNRFAFANSGDPKKMINIFNWGIFAITLKSGFYGCENLTNTASDKPTGQNYTTVKPTTLRTYFRKCKLLNGPLNQWGSLLSNVTTMQQCFLSASDFNQPLSLWDTSSVTNMNAMFQGAQDFNQDISNWDINQVTNFTNFMLSNTALSTANYNSILIAWAAQGAMDATTTTHFGDATYGTSAASARDTLIATNWAGITDGGAE